MVVVTVFDENVILETKKIGCLATREIGTDS
jgi:hypothetical protein